MNRYQLAAAIEQKLGMHTSRKATYLQHGANYACNTIIFPSEARCASASVKQRRIGLVLRR
jgi:hypothetical protein